MCQMHLHSFNVIRNPKLKVTLYLITFMLAIGILLPRFLNQYIIGSVIFLFAIYSILALSYDILGGLAGYMNLGHAVFFGIGAYSTAILFRKIGLDMTISLVIAPIVVALFAFLFSFPLFRLRGFYFAVGGLAFVQLANLFVASMNAKPITNGFDGITFVQYDIVTPYYASIGLLAFSVLLYTLVSSSKLGLALRSIKQDEEVANSSGINVAHVKRIALVISAVIAGLDGAIYFWGRGAISPNAAFGFPIAFIPVTIALLGGTDTIFGPLVGGVIYVYLQNYAITYLQSTVPAVLYFPNAITGIILISVGLFLPGGVIRSHQIRSFLIRVYQAMK